MYRIVSKLLIYGDMPKDSILMELSDIFKRLDDGSQTKDELTTRVFTQIKHLLQVATDDLCFLFRLHHMGLPPALASLLADEAVPKVGLSLHDDVHQLRQRMPDLQPAGLIELQDVAEHMGLEDKSLQKLFANFFHMRISKGAQLSNWEADALTEAQRLYAATDAAACILLYREMLALQQSRDYQLVG